MYFDFDKKYNFAPSTAGELQVGMLIQDGGGFIYEVVHIAKTTPKTITITYQELIFFSNGGQRGTRKTISKRKSSLIHYVCKETENIERVLKYFNEGGNKNEICHS